jgi:hypothetical protein
MSGDTSAKSLRLSRACERDASLYGRRRLTMSNWLLNPPVVWIAVVIFACAYLLLAALIH